MPVTLDQRMTETVRMHFRRDVEIISGLLEEEPTPNRWPSDPGSALQMDDVATAGYEPISTQVSRLLYASTDFLHGVSSMILKANILHTYAEYAMIRSAIECAGTAWWLLESPRQRERVERSLKVFWEDTKDVGNLAREAPGWKETHRARLKARNEVARRNGIAPESLDGGFNVTAVLKQMADKMDSGVLTAWRVASGMAHGRTWAMMALSAKEVGESDSDLVPVRISVDVDSLALVHHTAAIAMQDAYAIFHKRRRRSDRTPLGLPIA